MSMRIVATDAARVAPLGAAAWYMEFVSTYGSTILTTLGIVYAAINIYFRVTEHMERKRGRERDNSKPAA